MGLKDDDYLIRGAICIPNSFSYSTGGYRHGWVEFTLHGKEYVFDSMCIGVVPKDEWYEHFKPEVKFKHSKKEILNYILPNTEMSEEGCYLIPYGATQIVNPKDKWHTANVFGKGKLFMRGNSVMKFIAYCLPGG